MDDDRDTVPEPAIRRSDSALRLTTSRYVLSSTIGEGGMSEVIDATSRSA